VGRLPQFMVRVVDRPSADWESCRQLVCNYPIAPLTASNSSDEGAGCEHRGFTYTYTYTAVVVCSLASSFFIYLTRACCIELFGVVHSKLTVSYHSNPCEQRAEGERANSLDIKYCTKVIPVYS